MSDKLKLDLVREDGTTRLCWRIVVLCNPCRNTEAGPEDKQDWMIICFRGP